MFISPFTNEPWANPATNQLPSPRFDPLSKKVFDEVLQRIKEANAGILKTVLVESTRSVIQIADLEKIEQGEKPS